MLRQPLVALGGRQRGSRSAKRSSRTRRVDVAEIAALVNGWVRLPRPPLLRTPVGPLHRMVELRHVASCGQALHPAIELEPKSTKAQTWATEDTGQVVAPVETRHLATGTHKFQGSVETDQSPDGKCRNPLAARSFLSADGREMLERNAAMAYGSLYNRLYESSRYPEPEVGMGATMLFWSDRHAATIVEVVRFKTGQRAGQVKSVTVQRDTAVRQDNNGMSDAQDYEYRRNPDGELRTYKVNKQGRFDGLAIGFRDEYYDYSF